MKTLSLMLILPLAACVTTAAAPRPEPVAIDKIAIGQTTFGKPVRVGALRVTPRAVIEDSRCPMNARCIWAGRVRLRADVAVNGQRSTHELTLGTPVMIAGRMLTLTSVDPSRVTNVTLTPRHYRFGFEVRQPPR